MKKALFAIAILAIFSNGAFATVWWDINGATAGAGGASPSGIWSTSVANWGNTTGTAATAVYGADTTARFSAGADATAAFTVTVSGTVNATVLGVEEGDPTFTGGTINFINAAGATSLLTGIAGGEANVTITMDSIVAGTNGFRMARSTVVGTHILNLNNTANTFTGGFGINSGQLIRLGASGVIPDANVVGFNATAAAPTLDLNGFSETVAALNQETGTTGSITLGAGTLTLANPTGQAFQAVISGTGSLVKNGAGTQILTGTNTYTGGTTIGAGILQIGNGGTTGALTQGTTANSPISVGATGTLRFNRSDTASQTVNGLISGNGAIEKQGANTIQIGNPSSTFSGTITITSGGLAVDGDANLGAASAQVTLAGGRLITAADRDTLALANPINMTASSAITATTPAANAEFTLSGALTGSAGTLTLRNDGADAGTDLFDVRLTNTNLSFTQPIVIDNGATGLTRLSSFNAGGTQTFSGVISGNGRFNRSASTVGTGGVTILTSANTYTGTTTVNDGTLMANNTTGSATGTNTVTVNANGTLGGTGTVSGAVTVDGTLAPGASVGTLTLGDDVSLLGTLSIEYDDDGSQKVDLAVVTGDLTLGVASILTFDNINMSSDPLTGPSHILATYGSLTGTFASVVDLPAGYSLNYAFGGNNIALIAAAIPEASAFLFGGLAAVAGGIGRVVRRRKAGPGETA